MKPALNMVVIARWGISLSNHWYNPTCIQINTIKQHCNIRGIDPPWVLSFISIDIKSQYRTLSHTLLSLITKNMCENKMPQLSRYLQNLTLSSNVYCIQKCYFSSSSGIISYLSWSKCIYLP